MITQDHAMRPGTKSCPSSVSSCKSFSFPLDPQHYAKTPTPTVADWRQLWAAWDLVTRCMIPEDELLSKPIHLRNCCIFYLGHIPAFLDKQLTSGTGDKPTEPAHFVQLFERGIDPDVDNPELCHAHSEIPDEWPPLADILQYQEDVRARVLHLYDSGVARQRRVARMLWLGLEHEVMHLETLLYMLLQSDNTLPPPGPRPDFAALAAKARARRSSGTEWVHIPQRTVKLGMHDPDNDEGPDRFFGWDNEKPERTHVVPSFEASTRPITNGDYARYLEACNIHRFPVSWKVDGNDDSGKAVRTVYGAVPLQDALDWPVMASYDELSDCARWLDGRIPTMEEAQSIYAYVEAVDRKALNGVCSKTIPAVNGHLSNDGVQETPPDAKSPDPAALFADLTACNVGFRAFHPLPTALLDDSPGRPAGRAGLGGVWEWTSSVFSPYPGFQPMPAYPAYSADFFDGKHNVVLGGSWATHPRIAGRKSFVNWYQRNYPYAWCGARLVRDIKQ